MGIAQTALVAVSSFLTVIASLVTVAEPNQNRDLTYIESIAFNISLRDFDRSRFIWRRQQPGLTGQLMVARCQLSAAKADRLISQAHVAATISAIAI